MSHGPSPATPDVDVKPVLRGLSLSLDPADDLKARAWRRDRSAPLNWENAGCEDNRTPVQKRTRSVKPSHSIRPVFDDPNVVADAGLAPVLRLAEAAGFHEALAEHLSVESPNRVAKTGCVVAGMLAGADSIEDLDRLRHGGMGKLFCGVRAPSTLGKFLRAFTHGHVQQLDKIGALLLVGLAALVPGLLAGSGRLTGPGSGTGEDGWAFLDVDDTIREVHGYAKQGAGYGYSKVRGLNIQLAALSTLLAAPVVLRARLRKGATNSARGVARLLAQAIKTARAAGVAGTIMCRADSAYYGWAFIGTAIRHKSLFSVTARMTPSVKKAITAIPEQAWTPIEYPNAIFDETEQRWVSDAEVAEVEFTAFAARRKSEHVTCRLIVRRVKRLQPLASDGTEQGELFAAHRHHAFVTNSTLGMVAADQMHRDHAIIEQVIADLKDNALAHLPSGTYAANAAWVALAIIAYNLARAAAVATGDKHLARARWSTLQARIIHVPARIASTARRLDLHLPRDWPWAELITAGHARLAALP